VPVLRSLCVYCGSSSGTDPVHAETARSLGAAMAEADIRLVFGGGNRGLMGEVANAVLDAGGHVVGVIPRNLFRVEVAHRGVTELIEVDSMHERKLVMFDAADAFVALPGGFGTLEELAEVITWAQIGTHTKPIGVLDPTGYWSPLFAFLDGAVREGFVKDANRNLIVRSESPAQLLDDLCAYDVPYVDKWVEPR
jgi:uncharacterized protein (TIGR00730 family)